MFVCVKDDPLTCECVCVCIYAAASKTEPLPVRVFSLDAHRHVAAFHLHAARLSFCFFVSGFL